MINLTPSCPICYSLCGYTHWILRITDGPIEEMPTIYCTGVILGISKEICIGQAWSGKIVRKDLLELGQILYSMGFKTFYAKRQAQRRLPFGTLISSGFFSGYYQVDLEIFAKKI
jgi:hypothetical protein